MVNFFKLISVSLLLSAFNVSNSSAQSVWQWQEPQPTGNFMWALDFVNENTGYAAGDVGTVMKTTNGGLSWEVKIVDPNFRAYGMYFYDADFGFLSGTENGKLYRTTNGGENWIVVLTAGVNAMWEVNFPTRHTGYAVGLNGRIYKSTDAGLNWTQQSSGTNTFLFCVDFLDSLNGVIGGATYVSKTTNGGINWIIQNVTFTNPFTQVTSINYIDQSTIYGLTTGKAEFLRTSNAGANWDFIPVNYPYINDIPRKMSFNGLNNGNIVTNFGLILSTTNAGTSWAIDSSFKPLYRQIGVLFNVKRVSEQIAYVSGSGGRIIKSTNAGQNWFATTGGRYNYNSNYFVNQSTGFTAGNDGKILKTTNAGLNWIELQSNTIQNLNEVTFTDENTGYVCGDTGTVLKTTDGGESWFSIAPGVSFNLWSIDFSDFNTGFCVGKFNQIIKTSNGGINWSSTTILPYDELFAIKMYNSEIAYISSEIKAYKTTNGGLNWITLVSGGFDLSVPDSITCYTSFGGGNIFATKNGGINWIIQNSGIIENLNAIYFIDPNNGYSAGDGGAVTKTTNGGTTWIPQTRLTNNNLKSVFFTDADNGYITGEFGTLIKTTNGGLVFISSDSETMPEEFKLYQNFPNPFNSSTVIKYDIQRKGNVEMKLYDITGKLISTLVKEVQEKGSYSVLFSPENNEMELQSGFFFTHFT